MDVPELTDELTKEIADQSDAQSGHMSIRELEQLRDNNLVAMMRALKGQNAAAGALLNTHQEMLSRGDAPDFSKPMQTVDRVIPVDWVDYNGHMNESRYGQVFSDAADAVMSAVGADEAYVAKGLSYFTVDIDIKFLLETHAGQKITVMSHVLIGEGKKLKLFHQMLSEDGDLLATGEQFLLHVSLETRRTCEPESSVLTNVEAVAAAHAKLPDPRKQRG